VRILAFLAAGVVSWGCLPRCNLPVYFPGLEVTVTNAETGEPVDNAVVTATTGEYTETLYGSGGSYSGAGSGTYDLTVEADGFESQTIRDIVVELTPDGCYAVTEYIDVQLTPLSD